MTAKEITEDLMQITESTVIRKNVHSCWIVRMNNWDWPSWPTDVTVWLWPLTWR